jgi:hypothetical protein
MKKLSKIKENGELPVNDERKQAQSISSNNEEHRDRELKTKIVLCTRYFPYTSTTS